MAENTGIETIQDDDLVDEALSERDGGKFTFGCTMTAFG
jgi:hypothetical protein